MQCEGDGHAVGGKVQLGLWPALIQKKIPDRMRDQAAETVLVRVHETLQ